LAGFRLTSPIPNSVKFLKGLVSYASKCTIIIEAMGATGIAMDIATAMAEGWVFWELA
jgi:hypothetical protein